MQLIPLVRPQKTPMSSKPLIPLVLSGKLAISGYYEASSLRPSVNQVASIVRVLTVSCLLLTVSLIGISPSSVIKALLDSGASLNLIHEGLVQALGLATEP